MLTHPGISQVLRHTCYNLSAQNTLICPADIQLSCSLKRTEPWYVCFLVLHPISAYFNVKTKLLASFHLRFWHSASQHIVRDVEVFFFFIPFWLQWGIQWRRWCYPITFACLFHLEISPRFSHFYFFFQLFHRKKWFTLHMLPQNGERRKKINQRVLLFQTSKCSTPSKYLHV